MLDHAAILRARRLPAQLDGYFDFNALMLRNAGEIDVQQFQPEGIPLQFANEGFLVNGAFQVNDAAAVPDGGGNLVGYDGQTRVLFSVPVQHGGNAPRASEAAGLAFSL